MKFHFAPVQGHTDAPYRHYHHHIYGNDLTYYTPFIRLEEGKLRKRDIKDFTSSLNSEAPNVPQIIFRDEKELVALIDLMKQQEVTKLNLNMGCPFPLQTGHGRGAATVANENLAKAVRKIITDNPDINFSVKIRLGMIAPDEWKVLLPYLNDTHISHLAVHPRVARQQYSGELYLDQFNEILTQSVNPVVYNGEIHTPHDIQRITLLFPEIEGIMIGRGLLGRPSLINEATSGNEWPREKRLEMMLKFHQELLNHYTEELCGDTQIISKIKPFWEYAEEEIGRKAWKAIKKAGNIAKYHSAVALITQQ